jgi:hypothetical protein
MTQLRRNANVVWPPHPPPDETAAERSIRLDEEKEAKRISDAIDEALVLEREREQKRQPDAKILLLGEVSIVYQSTLCYNFILVRPNSEGQAESGKSTVLKNFQLHFAPKAFQAQTEAWRPIIQLNLVRSINFILDTLGASNSSLHGFGASSPILDDDLRRQCIKLVPLRSVEETLRKRLDGPTSPPLNGFEAPRYNRDKASEVSIRSGSRWKAFTKFRHSSDASTDTPISEMLEDSQTRRIIGACADDMASLWANRAVQSSLSEQGIVLQSQPGLFVSLTLIRPTY